jgi:hypothetical protein
MKKNIFKAISELEHKGLRLLLALAGRALNWLLTTYPLYLMWKNYGFLKGYELSLTLIGLLITTLISYYVLGFWQFVTQYWKYHG